VAGLAGPAPYWQSFTYDVTGNRRTRTDHTAAGDTVRTSSFPDAGGVRPHALTGVTATGPGAGTDTFSYDATGNLRTRNRAGKPGQTLTWDAEGRLATIVDSAGTTTYVYAADGTRLLAKEPGGTTLYIAGQEVRLSGGALTVTRFYGSHAVRTAAGGLTWTTVDHHGTNRLVFKSGDLGKTQRRTTPFDEVRGPNPAWPTTKGFVGGTSDPTGLVHIGAREYDPTHGRFILVDPIFNSEDPESWNNYAYARNNPVTRSDPTGLCYGRQDGDLCPGNTRGPWAALDDAARDRHFGGGTKNRKLDKSFTSNWKNRPLPPPPTCSPATPEYCHAPGSRRESTYDLGYRWLDREIEGLINPCLNPTSVLCADILYFRERDVFTQEIWLSNNFDFVLNEIMAGLSAGREDGRADFHYTKMPSREMRGHLARDSVSIATRGALGSQRVDSYVGSYDADWRVVGNDEKGNPVVEIHLQNATTLSSGTPIPFLKNPGDGRAGSGGDAYGGERFQIQSVRFRMTF
jgi:RHS repeat-associated protein